MRSELTPAVNADDHHQGPATAPVTLVMFGDYECPQCARAHPVVKTLRAVLQDELRLVFRQFPIRESHPHAQHAAEAAEAAAAQGRFWDMHDLLYKNQRALDDANLIHYARDLALDVSRFQSALETGQFTEAVNTDRESGRASGVSGTPTFFINGVRHTSGFEYDALYEAIMAAMPESE
jgi:formate-nitrite transporter family protein